MIDPSGSNHTTRPCSTVDCEALEAQVQPADRQGMVVACWKWCTYPTGSPAAMQSQHPSSTVSIRKLMRAYVHCNLPKALSCWKSDSRVHHMSTLASVGKATQDQFQGNRQKQPIEAPQPKHYLQVSGLVLTWKTWPGRCSGKTHFHWCLALLHLFAREVGCGSKNAACDEPSSVHLTSSGSRWCRTSA
jgi:hypothetical protein